MNRHRSSNECPSTDDLDPEQILTNWMNTVASFHLNYSQLDSFISAHEVLQQTNRNADVSMGQCPIRQLRTLLSSMHEELETLLRDIERSAQAPVKGNFQKLAAHTRILEQLNQQAQKLLVLTMLSAS